MDKHNANGYSVICWIVHVGILVHSNKAKPTEVDLVAKRSVCMHPRLDIPSFDCSDLRFYWLLAITVVHSMHSQVHIIPVLLGTEVTVIPFD